MTEILGKTSWATELVEYYKQGYSDMEVAAALNITRREFNQLLTDNPAFAKLVEVGRTQSSAFWEGLARQNVKNKTFNTPLYNFYMKNKFGWADKIETNNVSENTNLSLDQLKTEINKKLKDLKDQNSLEVPDAHKILEPVDFTEEENE